MTNAWKPERDVGLNEAVLVQFLDAATDQHLSPERLADRCVSGGRTIRWIFDRKRVMTVPQLEDIAQGLGLQVEDLLDNACKMIAAGTVRRASWYTLPMRKTSSSDEADSGDSSSSAHQPRERRE